MSRSDVAVVALSSVLALAGCEAGGPPIETGPPVSPEALCAELARVVCDAADDCCDAAGAPTGCEVDQEQRCMDSLGAMVGDPRVGYVPERAGALVARVRERAASCFETPLSLPELDVIFEGTVPAGGDCSPGASDGVVRTAELHRAAVACEDFASCRLRAAWDGSPLGTCEPRERAGDDRCSHPYDCGDGTFCDLPSGWRIGDWGRCVALREDGWACESDLECASGDCGDGTCGAPAALDRCLVIDYPTLVLEDAPILYQRLADEGDRATDASGRGNHASFEGTVARGVDGAIDDDGAIGLDAMGGHLTLASVSGMGVDALTIEAWIAIPDGGGGPLLVMEGPSSSLVIDVVSAAVRARFIEPGATEDDPDTVYEIATEPGSVTAGFHHVALVYDGVGTRIHVDGVEAAEHTGVQRLPSAPALTIGGRITADASSFFNGAIDELAIYPGALEPAAIAMRVRVATMGPIENDFVLFGWARRADRARGSASSRAHGPSSSRRACSWQRSRPSAGPRRRPATSSPTPFATTSSTAAAIRGGAPPPRVVFGATDRTRTTAPTTTAARGRFPPSPTAGSTTSCGRAASATCSSSGTPMACTRATAT